MFCPECGFEAADAKFCPECGADLAKVRAALHERGRTTGAPGKGRTTGAAGRARTSGDATRDGTRDGRSGLQRAEPSQTRRDGSGFSPLYLWMGVVAMAVIAAVAVFMAMRTTGNDDGGAATGAGAPVADTSGSYQELVARANAFYDQGAPFIDKGDFAKASPYFASAAKVYAAAWKKQSGDPAVGTDYATSLFYSGDIQGAIAQVNDVLKDAPTFQNALFNKGNFVAMAARQAEQSGQKAKADNLFAQAREAYQAAVKSDPQSQSGQAAAQALKAL